LSGYAIANPIGINLRKFATKSGSLYDTKQRVINLEETTINSIYSKVASVLQFILNSRADELAKPVGLLSVNGS